MTEVYLIRHSLKMHGPVGGDFAVFDRMQPLSAAGEERAKQLLEFPALRGAGFAVASTMSRSLATIRYLLEADNVPYAIDDRLRELDFGTRPQGQSMDEFMSRKWQFPDEVPEGGESITQCRARMKAAIQEAVEAHPGQKLLIGSHGAAIGAFLSGVLEDVGDDFVRTINLPDVFHLTYEDGNVVGYERLEMPFPLPMRGPDPGKEPPKAPPEEKGAGRP